MQQAIGSDSSSSKDKPIPFLQNMTNSLKNMLSPPVPPPGPRQRAGTHQAAALLDEETEGLPDEWAINRRKAKNIGATLVDPEGSCEPWKTEDHHSLLMYYAASLNELKNIKDTVKISAEPGEPLGPGVYLYGNYEDAAKNAKLEGGEVLLVLVVNVRVGIIDAMSNTMEAEHWSTWPKNQGCEMVWVAPNTDGWRDKAGIGCVLASAASRVFRLGPVHKRAPKLDSFLDQPEKTPSTLTNGSSESFNDSRNQTRTHTPSQITPGFTGLVEPSLAMTPPTSCEETKRAASACGASSKAASKASPPKWSILAVLFIVALNMVVALAMVTAAVYLLGSNEPLPHLVTVHGQALILHGQALIRRVGGQGALALIESAVSQVIQALPAAQDSLTGVQSTPASKPDTAAPAGRRAVPRASKSPRGSSGCKVGSFKTAEGACQECAPGTFSVAAGSEFCTACPTGYWSELGASECKLSEGYAIAGAGGAGVFAFAGRYLWKRYPF